VFPAQDEPDPASLREQAGASGNDTSRLMPFSPPVSVKRQTQAFACESAYEERTQASEDV